MRTLITIILAVLLSNANALRCGTSLVDEGDSINKVIAECNVTGSYSNIGFTAPDKLYVDDGHGMTCEIRQANGIITNIECNR